MEQSARATVTKRAAPAAMKGRRSAPTSGRDKCEGWVQSTEVAGIHNVCEDEDERG